jgi:hypothetical protein
MSTRGSSRRQAVRCAIGAGAIVSTLAAVALPSAGGAVPAVADAGEGAPHARGFTADGRSTVEQLSTTFRSLSADRGWEADTIYSYPGEGDLAIRAWRTARSGEALGILAGIHGEEPAGPNAIARSLASIVDLAASGVSVVVIPLCSPKAYRNNWRYPNTPERDWRKGGYSVGDAEHLLPDLEKGTRPRAAGPPGPEARALTAYVLHLSRKYPPRLVLDLHEDELSAAGGYIYSQGSLASDDPIGAEVIRQLTASGIPIRQSGRTRFGEPIAGGVISRDDDGSPIRDGSIDELLGAAWVFEGGARVAGPAARTVIVVETPAFAGSRLELRVAAQSAVVRRVGELWRLGAERSSPER